MTEQNKKRSLQLADAAERTTVAKRPKASGKKAQAKLTNIIKTDTTVCMIYCLMAKGADAVLTG